MSRAAGGLFVSEVPFVAGGIIDWIVAVSADNAGSSESVRLYRNAFVHIPVVKRNNLIAVGNLEPLPQSFESAFQAADLLFDRALIFRTHFEICLTSFGIILKERPALSFRVQRLKLENGCFGGLG